MVTVRGRSEVKRYIAQLPEALVEKVLRGAARAGGKVIADEAKARSESDDVADAIIIRSSAKDGRIVVTVTVKPGWAYSLGVWLEWGTDPHFITVDDSQRAGMSVRKVNEKTKAGSLVIGGAFVGKTVWHEGARPFPFLRPALDIKEAEAVKAAQQYINSRVTRAGIRGGSDMGDDA